MINREQFYHQQLKDLATESALWDQWWQSMTSTERSEWLIRHRTMRELMRFGQHPREEIEQRVFNWTTLTRQFMKGSLEGVSYYQVWKYL